MIKRIAIVITALVVVASPVVLYQAGVAFGLWRPIKRPAGVPSQARYFPGLKESTWFDCSIDHRKDVNVCRAWNEAGTLIARGNFRLDEEKRAATADELKPDAVQIYPGRPDLSWIYLRDTRSGKRKCLVPVNDGGIPLERFEVQVQGGR